VSGGSQEPTETAAAISPKFGAASATQNKEKREPFAFADFTWLTGNPRTKESPINTEYFTGEFRADVAYHHDFNHPKDNTISGSSEVFRSGEVNLTQLGIGGDFHYNNVRGRLLTQFGMYSQTQPRNDASAARGQWNLDNAYRYLACAISRMKYGVFLPSHLTDHHIEKLTRAESVPRAVASEALSIGLKPRSLPLAVLIRRRGAHVNLSMRLGERPSYAIFISSCEVFIHLTKSSACKKFDKP
jgi:hypothetical protein